MTHVPIVVMVLSFTSMTTIASSYLLPAQRTSTIKRTCLIAGIARCITGRTISRAPGTWAGTESDKVQWVSCVTRRTLRFAQELQIMDNVPEHQIPITRPFMMV